MSNKPTIEILVEKAQLIRGTEYFYTMKALREYVYGLTDVDFLAEIVRVTNPKIFGLLWSVGLSQRRQEICAQREKELR